MSDRIASFTALLRGSATAPFLTSAWQHFVGREYDPVGFAAATVEFNRRWDWDWVKINPRAIYYSEVWGSVYDHDDYEGPVPRLLAPALQSTTDLATIGPIEPGASPVLTEHIDSARLIREQLPDRPLLQTVFSPLSVLLQLAGLPLYPGDAVYGSRTSLTHDYFPRRDPAGSHTALAAIADTLAAYVAELLKPQADGGAGLDGIFYAVTGTASADFFDPSAFNAFSRPYDRRVLDAVGSKTAVLHTCRANSHPNWFADYPVNALHWDQFLPANPPISTDFKLTPIGGVNYELFFPGSNLTEVRRQLNSTLAARSGQPFLLAPSCTIPTPADDAALNLLRAAH
jgi:uroporphyrinogen decarboxylase